MPNTSTFDPAKDIPAQTDKVILVTGGTAGLGKGAILALAQHAPAHLVFSGRNQKNADALIAAAQAAHPGVQLTFLECDLASLKSVQAAAHRFLADFSRLDVLMLNAGVMAKPAATTADGYEVQFATNHLGHALLVKLLLPRLESAPGSRIVSVASSAYQMAPGSGIEFKTLRTDQSSLSLLPGMATWSRYGQSKMANMLYPIALAKHHPSVLSVAIHPGVIKTGLFDGMIASAKPMAFMIQAFSPETPVEKGHWNQVWAATCDKKDLENGGYYEPIGAKTKPRSKNARDEALAERLWTWTEEALKDFD